MPAQKTILAVAILLAGGLLLAPGTTSAQAFDEWGQPTGNSNVNDARQAPGTSYRNEWGLNNMQNTPAQNRGNWNREYNQRRQEPRVTQQDPGNEWNNEW